MPQLLNLEYGIFNANNELGIPDIQPVHFIDAQDWIGFNLCKNYITKTDRTTGVHFFIDDYRFERVWNFPKKYIDYLSRYAAVLSPDFSIFTQSPAVVNMFNHYRKHWLACFWQSVGITVVPTISWGDESSYSWCFLGEPKNSIVAISDVGCLKSERSRYLFECGCKEMIKRLEPIQILYYTNSIKSREFLNKVPTTFILNWMRKKEK